jgi:general secretion pathway protein C
METVFRKYFWAVNLLFVAILALIAAHTVNLFVESKIAPTSLSTGPRAVHRAPIEAPAGLNLEKVAKLTGLPLPKVEVAEGPSQQQFDPNAAPVKTSLPVKLLGTLLSGDPQWSLASIQDTGSQDTATYMAGDKVQGAEVLSIERERVIIMNNGRKEFIDGQAGSGGTLAYAAPPMRTSTPVQEPAQGDLGAGINCTGDQCAVPKSTIDGALTHLNELAMQARIVPAFKDGQSEGFKLFSIRPDSLYSKIGIVNGDVIRRINGFEMNDPAKALEVYQKLKDSSRIDIEIDRNGSIIHKSYNIQ